MPKELIVALAACCLIACSSSDSGHETTPDVAGLEDTTFNPDGTEPSCGDGVCDAGENCLTCPSDCRCVCGDGVCTAGEYCALCPPDCDCDTLAATPPMGWNSWNRFACDVSAVLIEEMADAMVTSGLRDVGYQYVNVDDCWQIDRGEDGVVIEDPDRFPEGMGALADAIHAKGLKFGLYTDAGTMTCQERPGSLDHELVDAQTYAAWGVDYVKVDWCFSDGLSAPEQYAVVRDALQDAEHPIVFSICNWGVDAPWVWGPDTGHLWRTTGDIGDIWPSVMVNVVGSKDYAAAARPGHWNDPDMLEVGNGGMTSEEYRTHFNLWAIMAAPLIAGNDLRDMDTDTLLILSNTEVIAVDQDPDGIQGILLPASSDLLQVWARPLRQYGARAVVLFNASPHTAEVAVSWNELGLTGPVEVRDLWAHENLKVTGAGYGLELPSHGSAMLKVVGEEIEPPAGESHLSDRDWMHAATLRGEVGRDERNGGALTVAGTTFEKGLAVDAISMLVYHLGQRCERFQASVGVDDASRTDAQARFELWGDGERLYEGELMARGDAPVDLDVDITEHRTLRLVVRTVGTNADGVLADWANARIHCQ